MSADDVPYSGFQWNHFLEMSDGPQRKRANAFIQSVDWEALIDYTAKVRSGTQCELLPHIGLGYNHMVRVLRFSDKVQWVARLRLPSLEDEEDSDVVIRMNREASTIRLVKKMTDIPVPEIYACETDRNCSVKAPFILMQCFDGNVGMDLGMEVPLMYQEQFFQAMAEIQVKLSTIQLPMIGIISRIDNDGTIHQGPIPGLGGPFATATEFFQAWCEKAKFGGSLEPLREGTDSFSSELLSSIESFPTKLAQSTAHLSKLDKGPFPLIHGDFGHNNIIVNEDNYQIVAVIDWETAFAAPWELAGDFPLTLATMPPAMDIPSDYDESGNPKDPSLAQKFANQRDYIAQVEAVEQSRDIVSPRLSDYLQDTHKQRLATGMRMFLSGNEGFYTKLLA